MRRTCVSSFLIIILLMGAPGVLLAAPADNQTANQTNTNPADWTPLSGEERFTAKENILLKELGQEHSYTGRFRRGWIVFWISIPVTLLLTFTLMDALARGAPTTYGDNRNRELLQPHYIYMFSTSLLTSLYVAIADARKYNPPERPKATDVNEVKFELPIVGIRF